MRYHSVVKVIIASVAIVCATAQSGRAAEPDFTIELGKRVGAITGKSTLTQLKEAYGAKNVKSTDLPGPEGTTFKGAIIFPGGEREMHVIWNPEKEGREVFDVLLVGKAWVIGGKLRAGASVAEVEEANGAAFTISGFEWDLGGYADFKGGKLQGNLMVRFETRAEVAESIMGDVQVSSRSKALLAAKPVVSEIGVMFR